MYYLAVAQYRISFQVTICVFMNYKNDITKVVMKRNMCQHNLDKHKTHLNTNTCISVQATHLPGHLLMTALPPACPVISLVPRNRDVTSVATDTIYHFSKLSLLT